MKAKKLLAYFILYQFAVLLIFALMWDENKSYGIVNLILASEGALFILLVMAWIFKVAIDTICD
ncbi:MAG: hypothetical protein UT21_C0006G0013 [Candidatus Woesebacteria bacterium GW2011_GWA1_39_11b]|nr:MAG: hypothetical protein UT21_C0006G0013 [Candidatus Woesebacteria bacterium GW2011_GWA1_39_11b]